MLFVCLDLKFISSYVIVMAPCYRRFLSAGSPFCRHSVAMILSYYLSFVDSCARVPVDSSCARVPVCPWIPRVPVCPCVRGFLVCPCARGFLVCPWIPRVPVCLCARVPVDSSYARVPVCPEAREETYLPLIQAEPPQATPQLE